MTIGRICQREVDTARAGEPIRTAAQRMDSRLVGTLVVVGGDGRPEGILTDRDVALRVVGQGRDPEATTVGDVMSPEVQTVFEEMPVEDALALMRSRAVRRLPVVTREGALIGVVSLDDILCLLAAELGELGGLIQKETPRSLARP